MSMREYPPTPIPFDGPLDEHGYVRWEGPDVSHRGDFARSILERRLKEMGPDAAREFLMGEKQPGKRRLNSRDRRHLRRAAERAEVERTMERKLHRSTKVRWATRLKDDTVQPVTVYKVDDAGNRVVVRRPETDEERRKAIERQERQEAYRRNSASWR